MHCLVLGYNSASVTAGTVLDEGPFTVTTEFVPEVCGDGEVAGEEACDDGNTQPNDGCSADCRTIEYGALCALAPLLSPAAPNEGTTAGGSNFFASSCSNTWYGSGPDRIYRYVAPSDGTFDLSLEQYDLDLVLAVFDDCGAPENVQELGCSSVPGTEQVSVPMATGQSIVVLVEGFGAGDVGPYSLTATFTP